MRLAVVAACAAMLALASNAKAQEAPVTPPDSIQMLLRGALRALATGQDQHFLERGTYTSDLKVLKQYPGCVIPEGVEIIIHHASEGGFAAEARYAKARGQSCVQWMGTPGTTPGIATLGGRRGEERPGRVVCDFDPS